LEVEGRLPTKHLVNCQNVYAELDAKAINTIDGRIWTGTLSTIVLKEGNYTNIVNSLKSMGCIEQLLRGGGPAVSIWRLFHPPTVELLQKVNRKPTINSTKTAQAALQANVVLETRVDALEKKVELLIRAVEPIVKAHQVQ
jgi:hypothetical protein